MIESFKSIFRDKEFMNKLVRLVLPITFQFFMFALVPVADSMMLVALNQDAMSAVSMATQVAFVLNLFIFAITSGVSMLAAQYWGKKDTKSIQEVWGFATAVLMPITAVFFVMAIVTPGILMGILTNVPEVQEYGILYLRIVSFSYLASALLQVIEVIHKNTGLIKVATVVSGIMVVLNIALNAVFIYGLLGAPAMGVEGAALATTLSQTIALIVILCIQVKKGNVKFKWSSLVSTRKQIRKDFVKYAGPVLVNQIVWGFGFTTLSIIMAHLGSDAVAANSIATVAKDLISCFCYSLGGGGAIMIGNELGANQLETAKLYGRRLCHLTMLTGVMTGLFIFALAPLIVRFVNLSADAKHYLFWMLAMCVYYMLGRSINSTVISGIFCSGGDTKFGMICDAITMWVVIIPAGMLAAFVFKWPILVVYFILNLDEIVKLPAVYIHYTKYKWVKNLTISGETNE